MQMKNRDKIDFVVTWLDANDPLWQEQFWKARGKERPEDKGRYRNWDIFKYWFRAVENYAPWVNKVFLVTNGKFPEWINVKCEKLELVKHSDFIAEKYLPTFNSCAIEINFNRINNLSEQFVYFNDDFFLNGPVGPEYYFKEGVPCDCNAEKFGLTPYYSPLDKFRNRIRVYCDIAVINHYFDRRKVVSAAPWKWYGAHLWGKHLLVSFIQRHSSNFEAFVLRHNEQPMLKSVIQEIWDKEPYMCEQTCSQFRQDISLNPYIIRYWQFATNRFHPVRKNYGKYFGLGVDSKEVIRKALMDTTLKSICLNDTSQCDDEAYMSYKSMLQEVFEQKFPKKSSFEI